MPASSRALSVPIRSRMRGRRVVIGDDANPGIRRAPRQSRSRACVSAITEAAGLLLDGGEPLTTNSIAERAGVSVGTLYQYFADREAILVAMLTQAASQRCAAVARAVPAPGVRAVHAFIERACAWRASLRVRRAADLLPEHAVDGVRRHFERRLEAAARPHAEAALGRPITPEAMRVVVHGLGAVIEQAARTEQLTAPRFVHELSIMAIGALSADPIAWRAVTGRTPREIGARRWWSPTRGVSSVRLVPRWFRSPPAQPRARATLEAIIAATEHQVLHSIEPSPRRVAERAGVSVGTIYRYLENRYAAVGQVGLGLLERFSVQFMQMAPAIWGARPARTVQELTTLALDPMRSPWARWLRRLVVSMDEGWVMREHVARLAERIGPLVTAHPWCGVEAAHVEHGLWAVDGVCSRIVEDDGMPADPDGFGALCEATAILVYAYYRIDRGVWPSVLAGEVPVDALHPPLER